MNNNNHSAGLGLGSVLTVIFVVLKLVGVIDWSWWWVMSPTLIETGLCVLVIIGCNIYSAQRKKRRAKKWDKMRGDMINGTIRHREG